MEKDPNNPYRPPMAAVADIVEAFDVREAGLATRGQRFGGSLIDTIVYAAIGLPIQYFIGIWRPGQPSQRSVGEQLLAALVWLLLLVLLNGYLLHKFGQTIGKRVAGTRIVAADRSQILPLWKIVLLRNVPWDATIVLPFAVNGFISIGEILFIFRKDRRCLHDLLAGTRVVAANVPWLDRNGNPGVQ